MVIGQGVSRAVGRIREQISRVIENMQALLMLIYMRLLQLYPRDFYSEFADEMQIVFADAITEAAQRGTIAMCILCWREVTDALRTVLYEHWLGIRQTRRSLSMSVIDISSNTGSLDYNTPSSWSETLLGAFVFLIYPITLATNVLIGWLVIPLHLPQPMLEAVGLTYRLLEMALLLLVWILGWVRNFPRWSFAWIGFSVFFTLLYTSMPLPGSRDLIGWWIALAWVIALGIGLFLTRSLRPLGQFAKSVWNDWTRLSFALYGITPLLLLLAFFDEVNGEELFVTGLALVLALGALAYLRSAEVWRRISSLVVTHALV